MAGQYNKPVRCGRESAHKSRAAIGSSTLGECTWRDQHLLGEVGEHPWGLGEVSCYGFCQAKTVRRCFRACGNFLLTPSLCQRRYFVDTNILSTRIFCWRQHLAFKCLMLQRNAITLQHYCIKINFAQLWLAGTVWSYVGHEGTDIWCEGKEKVPQLCCNQ